MLTQHDPPHPGETLREDVLPALGLTVSAAAEQLGVTRAALSRVLHGRAAISPEMALRLEKWLGPDRGGSARVWLAMQSAYDLWQARKSTADRIRKVKRLPRTVVREHAAARK
jgi:addiction module HigA family antidote